jgi:hypothetical protein
VRIMRSRMGSGLCPHLISKLVAINTVKRTVLTRGITGSIQVVQQACKNESTALGKADVASGRPPAILGTVSTGYYLDVYPLML